MPLGLGLHVMAEICRGLAYAHARTGPDGKRLGIVHRDVSPHNVLVGEQGDVKLTDFGIAKALGSATTPRTGIIKGKLDFMSPEQASGEALAPSSDIFAVGTILYLLATGRRPFEGGSDLDVLLKVQRAEFVPLRRARPDLAPGVAAIVNKAMQSNPADRYQSGEAMMLDIEEVLRRDFGSPGQSELKRWLAELGGAGRRPAHVEAAGPAGRRAPGPDRHRRDGDAGAGRGGHRVRSTDTEQERDGRRPVAPGRRPAPQASQPRPARPSRSCLGCALLLFVILTGATLGALKVMSPGTGRRVVERARSVLENVDLGALTG